MKTIQFRERKRIGSETEFQIVASMASMLEEPSSILVSKLKISMASILLASNCLRNQLTQFETLRGSVSGQRIQMGEHNNNTGTVSYIPYPWAK